jgi:hypothetical protein
MRFILQAYSAHYNLAADDNDFYGGERANYDEA